MAHWGYRLTDGSYLCHRTQPTPYGRKVPRTGPLDTARVFNSAGAASNAARPVFYSEEGLKGCPVQLDRINHL